MSERFPMCRAYLLAAGGGAGASEPLETALAEAWEKGRAAWPGLQVEAEAFMGHLGKHVPPGEDVERRLRGLCAGDLYLAFACSQGLEVALQRFDEQVLSRVPEYIRRVTQASDTADEVQQVLRERMLLPRQDRPPRIAEYAGAGALRSWVRAAALRAALNLRRGREQPTEDVEQAAQGLRLEESPELKLLSTQHRQSFRDALRDAFAHLSPEQRAVLRLHFASGLSGERIAKVLAVSRATVVRWLSSARSAMFHETRRLLRERLRLSPRELESLIGVMQSKLDLTLTSVMRELGEGQELA